MAISEELLDELLSAYLDGALFGDEHTRVERMLQGDTSVQDRLGQMRETRQAFVAARWSASALPPGFSDQVVAAAIDRAIEDDLPANHPLRKAASVTTVGGQHERSWQRVGVAIAIAASVLIAGAVAWPLLPADDNGNQVAQGNADLTLDDPTSDDPALKDLLSEDSLLADNDSELARDQVDLGGSSLLANGGSNGAADDEGLEQPKLSPAIETNGGGDQIAMSDPAAEELQPTPEAPATKPKLLPALKALLVFEVTLTELGKNAGAFGDAVTASGILSIDERKIDLALARAVGDQVQSSDQLAASVSEVVLLEAPIKKLDLLVARMTTDQQAFASVRFSMIGEAPLLNSIQSVRYSDPTKIKHSGQMIPIGVQESDAFAAWSSHLGNRPFAPAGGEQARAVLSAGMSSDPGPNPMGSLLLLVR